MTERRSWLGWIVRIVAVLVALPVVAALATVGVHPVVEMGLVLRCT